MKKPPIDLVYSGGGSLVCCQIGAHARILESREVARIAGTSAGAIIACAHAFGMPAATMTTVAADILGNGVLDRAWFWRWRERWGLYWGDKILDILEHYFPGRLGDARIPWGAYAYDLSARRARLFSSWTHPTMSAAALVRASISIPGIFKAVRLPGFGERLFVDGGVTHNEPFDVFDDIPARPTIGVRFRSEPSPADRIIDSTDDVIRSLLVGVYNAANAAHVSRKRWADVIEIRTDGDSLDFDLDENDIARLWRDGHRSADNWFALRDGIDVD